MSGLRLTIMVAWKKYIKFHVFCPQSSTNDLGFLVFLLALMYYAYTCTPDSPLPTTTKNNETISQLLCLVELIYNFICEENSS